MEPVKLRGGRPEGDIEAKIVLMLEHKGWYVKKMGASAFLSGIPDLFACHKVYGYRWIEVKLPEMKGSKFTPAQLQEFPKLVTHGSQVWILTAATQAEYDKLFKKGNLWVYMQEKH